MPSKNYNGNNPLGRSRIKPNGLDPSGAFAKVETAIGRLQPALSLQTGSMQLPNGRVQKPKRARRGGGGGGAACVPWKPSLVNTSETDVPNYKIRLSPGTINGVINSAWDDLVNLPANYENTMYYILATVSFAEGQVTGIVYSLSATLPAGNSLNPVAVDALPAALTIILGTTYNLTSCMVWAANLNVASVDIFRETLPAPTQGQQPYKVWYAYQTSAATA